MYATVLCVCVCVCCARIHEKQDHQLSFKQVASGTVSRGYLDPTDGQIDIYILHKPPHANDPLCSVCVGYWAPCVCVGGKGGHVTRERWRTDHCSREPITNCRATQLKALLSVQEYVKTSKHPFLPITRVAQAHSLEAFDSALDDRAEVSFQLWLQDADGWIFHRSEATFKEKETVLCYS